MGSERTVDLFAKTSLSYCLRYLTHDKGRVPRGVTFQRHRRGGNFKHLSKVSSENVQKGKSFVGRDQRSYATQVIRLVRPWYNLVAIYSVYVQVDISQTEQGKGALVRGTLHWCCALHQKVDCLYLCCINSAFFFSAASSVIYETEFYSYVAHGGYSNTE